MSCAFVWVMYCTPWTYCVNALSISTSIYRVIQEEATMFWEGLISVIVRKEVFINMYLILDDYRSYLRTFIVNRNEFVVFILQ
jgi:hypothetical protein